MPLLSTGSTLTQKLATEFKKDIVFDDEQGNGRKRAETSAQRYSDAIIQWLQPFAAPSATVMDIQDVANSGSVSYVPIPPTFTPPPAAPTTLPFAFTLVSKNSLNTQTRQGSAVMGASVKNSESQLQAAFFSQFQKDIPDNEVKGLAIARLNSSAGRLAKGVLDWIKDDRIDKITIEYVVTGFGTAAPPSGNPTISQAIGTTATSEIGFINKTSAQSALSDSLFNQLKKDLVADETKEEAEKNARNTANRISTGITNWIDEVGVSSINSITQYQDSMGVTVPTGGTIVLSQLRMKGNLANLL